MEYKFSDTVSTAVVADQVIALIFDNKDPFAVAFYRDPALAILTHSICGVAESLKCKINRVWSSLKTRFASLLDYHTTYADRLLFIYSQMRFNSVDLINTVSYHDDVVFLSEINMSRTVYCGRTVQWLKIIKKGNILTINDGQRSLTIREHDRMILSHAAES